MAKKRKPSSRQTAPPAQDGFLSKAFADVVPLADRHRLAPRPRPRVRAQRRPAELPLPEPSRAVRFVLERDQEYVSGYRSDAGPGAVTALKSSRWQPQDTLDLHGYRVHELEQELVPELIRRVRRGIRRLLIIHGKGLHSAGGIGVLALAVVEALTDGPAAGLVRALSTAPLRLGGSGALTVELDVPRAPRISSRRGE